VTTRKAVPSRGAAPSARRPGGSAAEAVLTRRYIESSALVAAVLEGDTEAKASIRAQGQRVTSALTVAETGRAVLRARLSGRITPQQERAAILTIQRFTARCHIVSITGAILAHVGRPFPAEPIRTLDAIHLSTAQALGDPPALVTIVTRDIRVRDNAIALGHPVE
jgi:predicted nucleic acid-binding protein